MSLSFCLKPSGTSAYKANQEVLIWIENIIALVQVGPVRHPIEVAEPCLLQEHSVSQMAIFGETNFFIFFTAGTNVKLIFER